MKLKRVTGQQKHKGKKLREGVRETVENTLVLPIRECLIFEVTDLSCEKR